MSSAETTITNASNVACHMQGSHLSFFVDLTKRVSVALLGSVKEGKVQVQGDDPLPFVVNLKLNNLGACMNPPKAIATLQGYPKVNFLNKDAVNPAKDAYWELQQGSLFAITVNTAGFDGLVASAPTGTRVRLLEAKSTVPKCFGIDLSMECEGGARFPENYLRSVSNARMSDSPARGDGGYTEESSVDDPARNLSVSGRQGDGGGGGSTSPYPVSRRLDMLGTTPEARAGAHEDDEDDGGSPAPHAGAVGLTTRALAQPGEVVKQDDTLTIDASVRQQIRILFYPEQYGGNVFKRDFPVLGDIGVQLLIEIAADDDPRVAPKREPKRPSSSAFSLLSNNKGRDRRAAGQKATNVVVDLQDDPERHEKCLVISFNGEETYDEVDVEGLLEAGAMNTSPELGGGGQGGSKSLIVASCSNLIKGNYIIDLSAVRVETKMPTEREVYIAVNAFFHNQGYVASGEDDYDSYDEEDEGDPLSGAGTSVDFREHQHQYTLDMLKTLNMDEVRTYVFALYSNFVHRAPLEERQNFSMLVWSCTRECIINKVFGRAEPFLEDMGHLVTGMIEA